MLIVRESLLFPHWILCSVQNKGVSSLTAPSASQEISETVHSPSLSGHAYHWRSLSFAIWIQQQLAETHQVSGKVVNIIRNALCKYLFCWRKKLTNREADR